jgi:hypothetical protein
VPGDAAVIDTYREAGFARCVLGVPPVDESRVLAVLDGHAGLVEPSTA